MKDDFIEPNRLKRMLELLNKIEEFKAKKEHSKTIAVVEELNKLLSKKYGIKDFKKYLKSKGLPTKEDTNPKEDEKLK